MLELLANPLNPRVLRALDGEPLRSSDLHERAGWPAQTTLRAAIGNLRDLGLVERVEVSRMPLAVANGLTDAGREALFVIEVAERWLAKGPQGPIPIDSDPGKAALKALSSGWSSTVVRALAEEPASLTDLDRLIPGISYPSLERRLSGLRATRQVAPAPGPGRGQPFEVTEWLRHSVAPLCAAGRCERRHLPDSAPVTAVEIEAAFLLSLPLVPLPETAAGVCVLSAAADAGTDNGEQPELAGVTVEVAGGAVVRCLTDLAKGTPTWALGSPDTWLDAVIDGRLEHLRLNGARPQLAADLVHGIHVALFGDLATSP